MNILVGEFLGTMVLVLLGNGVVANVSLEKSKGQDAGWLTIATGWAIRPRLAGFRHRPITRRTDRLRDKPGS